MSKSKQDIQIPLLGRIVSWVLGGIVLVVTLVSFVMMSAFGTSVYNDIQQYGLLLSIGVFAIGVFACGLIAVVLAFIIAIVRRITKWKWLQIPFE